MDKNTYNSKLCALVSDQKMFSLTYAKQTETVKSKINKIQPYLNTNYVVRSSEEFLVHVAKLKLSDKQTLVSLDIVSLFTNVPLNETTELIIAAAYGHQTKTPPQCFLKT